MMILLRTLIKLSFLGIVFYVGKQMGQSKSAQKELDVWRKNGNQKKRNKSC